MTSLIYIKGRDGSIGSYRYSHDVEEKEGHYVYNEDTFKINHKPVTLKDVIDSLNEEVSYYE